jgi:hypothetical protein
VAAVVELGTAVELADLVDPAAVELAENKVLMVMQDQLILVAAVEAEALLVKQDKELDLVLVLLEGSFNNE